MKAQSRNFLVRGALIIISLILILFTGREKNSEGDTTLTWSDHGRESYRLGMDVAGGSRLTYKADYSKYRLQFPDPASFNQAKTDAETIILQQIDSRISALGVSDYSARPVRLDDEYYIQIELGGVQDIEEAKNIIGKTVELEFRINNEAEPTPELLAQRKERAQDLLNQAKQNPALFSGIATNFQSDDIVYTQWDATPLQQLPSIYASIDLDAVEENEIYPTVVEGLYVDIPDELETQGYQDINGFTLFKLIDRVTQEPTIGQSGEVLSGQTLYTLQEVFIRDFPTWVPAVDPKTYEVLDAKSFESASVSADQLGGQVTLISFNEVGQRIFCNLTEANVGKQIAIFVGGKLVSDPVIQDKICGGSTQIQGDFTGQTCYRKDGSTYPAADHREGVKCMVENLNEGALPAPLILTQEEKVSPTLGSKSLNGVIIAGIVGFAAIFLYMFFLYGLRRAAVSFIVLLSFMIFLLAILKVIGYVISMSSLAALILTIGMSVDATILMFERVEEEAEKQELHSAIIDGCKRSWPAIRDGNLSTGLIALLLFSMGVNVFKGFGSMVIITIVIILLMVVPVTKMFLLQMSKKRD